MRQMTSDDLNSPFTLNSGWLIPVTVFDGGEIFCWIIIGSDRRPKTKQGIEGKIDRFRSGRVRVRDRVRVRFRSPI